MPNLSGWTGLILLLVVILLFAAPKLPQLARSLGQSMTIFKKEIKNKDADDDASSASAASTVSDPAAVTKADGADPSRNQ
jgi:sec-independent protein translocase protein TatA